MPHQVGAVDCLNEIVLEAPGGAHVDPGTAIHFVTTTIRKHLVEVRQISIDLLLTDRKRKFRNIGQCYSWV
jgi:acetyl-CoA carboxylase alpha subunit